MFVPLITNEEDIEGMKKILQQHVMTGVILVEYFPGLIQLENLIYYNKRQSMTACSVCFIFVEYCSKKAVLYKMQRVK